MTVSIQEQIKCVKREIGLRQRVYPRQIEAGRMSNAKATDELKRMQAVLKTLEQVEKGERLI